MRLMVAEGGKRVSTDFSLTVRKEAIGAFLHLRETRSSAIAEGYKEVVARIKENPVESIKDFFDIEVPQNVRVRTRFIEPPKHPPFSFSAPYDVAIDLTYACNMRCKHCYATANKLQDYSMTKADFITIVKALDQAGTSHLCLTGGEPLLHPKIFEIIEYAVSSTWANITLLTNGLLLEKAADKLRKFVKKRIFGLFISLDSSDPEEHDEFRGVKGGWEQTIKGIKIVKSVGIPFVTGTVVTQFNKNHLEDIVKLSRDLGATAAHFMAFMPAGRGEETYKTYGLPMKELVKIEYKLIDLARIYSSEDFKVTLDDFGYTFQWRKYEAMKTLEEIGMLATCSAGRTISHIDVMGNLYPCSLFLGHSEFVAGNLLRQSFFDVWLNSPVLNSLRIDRPQKIRQSVCRKCPYVDACLGGCPYHSYVYKGTIMAPDPQCPHLPSSNF